MSACAKFDAGRKFDLKPFLGDELRLRSTINFSTSDMPEDLHYEESYELLIPQDQPVTVEICPAPFCEDDKGTAEGGSLGQFEKVEVRPGEIMVLWPLVCHRVTKKGRFVVLKVHEKYKKRAMEDTDDKGCCPQQKCSLWDYCKSLSEDNAL